MFGGVDFIKEQSEGVAFGKIIWSNINMTNSPLLEDIPESERTPLVEWLLKIIAQQQLVIEQQRDTIAKLEAKLLILEALPPVTRLIMFSIPVGLKNKLLYPDQC